MVSLWLGNAHPMLGLENDLGLGNCSRMLRLVRNQPVSQSKNDKDGTLPHNKQNCYTIGGAETHLNGGTNIDVTG